MSAGSQTEIVMPRMGLTMEEGTVVAWLKDVGELVQAGEPLVEIETDKATVEIEAPANGVLRQIVGQPGETFPIGTVIGYLAAPGSTGAPILSAPVAESAKPEEQRVIAQPTAGTSQTPATVPGKVRASPAARRITAPPRRRSGSDTGQRTGWAHCGLECRASGSSKGSCTTIRRPATGCRNHGKSLSTGATGG